MTKNIAKVIQFERVVGMLPWGHGGFAMIVQRGSRNDRYIIIGTESFPLGGIDPQVA